MCNKVRIPFAFVETRVRLRSLIYAIGKISIADASIVLVASLKSRGVIAYSNLSMDSHVNSICRSANYHIRALHNVRLVTSAHFVNIIACIIICKRLNYFNSLLHGTPKTNAVKLQRLKNSTARVAIGTRTFVSITPVFSRPNWLPIP